MKFHHLGIAAPSIQNGVEFAKTLGVLDSIGEEVYDELQDATVCMAKFKDGTQVEFISGKRVEGVLKRGTKLYHTCWSVGNFDEFWQKLQDNGGVVLSEPKPAILFGGKRVAFAACELGIVEILEE